MNHFLVYFQLFHDTDLSPGESFFATCYDIPVFDMIRLDEEELCVLCIGQIANDGYLKVDISNTYHCYL